MDVVGQFVAVVLAAQRKGPGRGLRVAQPAAGLPLAVDALVAELVVVRSAAKIARRDLLQLALRVHRAGIVGARHRVRRL